MAEFYDLDGAEVSYEKWAEIFAGTDRFLMGTRIPEHGVKVSTVWIGLAWALESENGGRPLIFETMAFRDVETGDDGDWDDLGCWRWATREDALKGHAEIVDGITSGRIVLDYSSDE